MMVYQEIKAKLYQILKSPLLFLRNRLSERQFFIFSSILIGLSSGIAAILLKYFVNSIEHFINFYSHNYEQFFLFALFPFIGITLTVLYVKYFLKGRLKKGSAEIVYAIARNSSIIPLKETYAHLITSALTVGFGGSVGLESPMVSTGAALGSNYGRINRLSYKERTILLGCGAAAGIAAAFNSPIAGVLFAIEVLLTDVSASAFIPLIISAACGALVTKIILQEGVVLSFSLQQPFNYHNVGFYIALGILAGLISLIYTRLVTFVEHKMTSVIPNLWLRVIAGGSILFLLILIFPSLYGEGYESIKSLSQFNPAAITKNSILAGFMISDSAVLLFLGFLIFFKAIAAAVTISSGGNGGNFGPSLFVGAYLGFVFSRLVNISGFAHVPESNFTLVAMAGILSGVFYAPLTGIFLIAEITGGYDLMIPLMIVSALSVTVVHYFEPLSMEAKKLSKKLNLTIENRDKFLLSKLDLTSLIETDFSVIRPEDTLRTLMKVISSSRRNTFPVVNDRGQLVGLVHMDNIRGIIFTTEDPDLISIHQLMSAPAAVINTRENLHSVLKKFDDTNQWNLPVVDSNQYIGFVSKSSVLSKYRAELLNSI
jgi:CIC family chloride channel protein